MSGGVFGRDLVIVGIGGQVVGRHFLIAGPAESFEQRAHIAGAVFALHAVHHVGRWPETGRRTGPAIVFWMMKGSCFLCFGAFLGKDTFLPVHLGSWSYK